MPVSKYPDLKLTGTVLDYQSDVKDRPTVDWVPADQAPADAEPMTIGGELMALAPAGPPDYAPGDIATYRSLDAAGRAAVRGRNANYGYSGYFKASVFDGKGWRNIELRDFLAESDRNYATQGEAGAVHKRLIAAVGALAGNVLVYGDRKYRMPGFTLPAPAAAPPDAPVVDAAPSSLPTVQAAPANREELRRRREAAEAEAKAIQEMMARPVRKP